MQASSRGNGREPLLNVRGLTVHYGHVLALSQLDLTVYPGELVCLLGGNACGKSTTMKSILGVVKLTAGKVALAGADVTRRATSDRIRSGLALVPENRELFPTLSVEENLVLGAYVRERRVSALQEPLAEIYELFPRLRERRDQSAGTLSGGEQQMVAMGRALMSDPKLILMDEPSMGLSPALVHQSFELLSRINEMGKAVLVVEQNANAALAIADYGYVLQAGQLVLEGDAASLQAHAGLQKAYLS